MPDLAELGKELRKARERAGMTERELAAKAGLTTSEVARFENGEVAIAPTRILYSLLSVLGGGITNLFPNPEQSNVTPTRVLPEEEERERRRAESEMPASLRAFAQRQQELGAPMPLNLVRSLATLQVHGTKVDRAEDWQFIYDTLLASGGLDTRTSRTRKLKLRATGILQSIAKRVRSRLTPPDDIQQ